MKGKKCYYVTFTDDATQLTWLYLLCLKSNTFKAYWQFEAWCKMQLGIHIKCLHSDKGGEYEDGKFVLHLKSKGTTQKHTVHDTPQFNSIAEQRNCTIIEHVCALLYASGLPKSL
jgi:hypothetical protein